MNQAKLNSKLGITLNQWKRIAKREMAISEDLRNMKDLDQANTMIAKIEGMIK